MMFSNLFAHFKNTTNLHQSEWITVVSGLPRSGTSMMMKMFEAGGMEILTDHQRVADDNNPQGYFELEKVKKMKYGDHEWLIGAKGKAVKIVSALLEHLPSQYSYRIIFMRRNMDEILASQRQMLIKEDKYDDKVSDERMAELFQKHLEQTTTWLAQQPNIKVIYVSYNDVLQDSQSNLDRVNKFLGGTLDIQSMLEVIDKNLYRQRG